MAEPSTVPSADRLCQMCAEAYEREFGIELQPELHDKIEALARHFFGRKQLESILIQKLIPQADFESFFRKPNKGHTAVADFLACGAIELAVSTNVDELIERAAEELGEPKAEVAITREEVTLALPHKPHVKLHGCFRRNIRQTLWCPEQLSVEPFRNRIREFKEWLPGVLANKDIVFLGFWSDWAYLNTVFEEMLTSATPRTVVLVNPSTEEELRLKAPVLWDLAHREGTAFFHAPQSGDQFLDELRQAYSSWFINRLFALGKQPFSEMIGSVPPQPLDLSQLNTADLYQMRLDATTLPGGKIARQKHPDQHMELLGEMHLEMQAAGAVLDGPIYIRSGKRVRLVHGAGQLLGKVKSSFFKGVPPLPADDVVICVGSYDSGLLPQNVAREKASKSVARPGHSGLWLTDNVARDFFRQLEGAVDDEQAPDQEV